MTPRTPRWLKRLRKRKKAEAKIAIAQAQAERDEILLQIDRDYAAVRADRAAVRWTGFDVCAD